MKREYKFRGLRTDGNGWVYGNYMGFNSSAQYILPFSNTMPTPIEVIPESVGLIYPNKDRKSEEMYQGDIVERKNEGSHTKEEYWNPIYEIVFDGYSFGVKHVGGGKDSDSGYFALRYRPTEFEKIGNIHEHKHLLK